MKKILATLVLVMTAMPMFAKGEHTLGVDGSMGFGCAISSDAWSFNFMPDLVMNGGFGINYRYAAALGSGNSKFIIGVQTGVDFTFGIKEQYTHVFSGEATTNVKKEFHAIEIPVVFVIGGRFGRFDLTANFGPDAVLSLGGKINSNVSTKMPVAGIGGVAGVDFGCNITKNHALVLGYKLKAGALIGDYFSSSNSSETSTTTVIYLDAANITLGYKYTF